MPTIVKMPQLGESVAEGTIGRWLKQPGDRVTRDEPLVEVLTDKVNAEVPSPVSGVLKEILTPEGQTVSIKTDIAVIAAEDEAEAATPAGRPPSPAAQGPEGVNAQKPVEAAAAAAPPPMAAPPASPAFTFDSSAGGGPTSSALVTSQETDGVAGPGTEAKRFYTPVVLRMAEEHGIDLATVAGSGLGGRVTRRDLERVLAERRSGAAPAAPAARPAAEAPTVASAAASDQPRPAEPPTANPQAVGDEIRALTPMRRAIARHMSQARSEIPDAWSMIEVDATRLVRLRDSLQVEWQAREGYELTFLPFFVKAVVSALQAVPELNATWQGDSVALHRRYDLGIAVSIEQGLVVPALRRADELSVAGLARALRALVQKARAGKLAGDDLEGVTFTVNNPGSLGSVMSQPVVPIGQAGIVTMEAIVKRPVVTADDAIAVRSMMNCCLSFDHRILDGAQALRFLRHVKDQIEAARFSLT